MEIDPKPKEPTSIESLIQNIDEPQKEQLGAVLAEIQSTCVYSGPIPSPEVMQQFKDVMNDAPDRIFTMAEKSQAHRHAMTCRVMEAETRAQHYAFTFSIISLIATVVCVFMDEPWVAGVLGGSTITMIVRYFMGGTLFRSKRKKEGEDEDEPTPPAE